MRLLNASFDSIWQNLGKALKVTLLPFATLLLIIGVLFFREVSAAISGAQLGSNLHIGPGRVVISMTAALFLFFLSTVLWHRAVLPAHNDKRFPLKETLVYLVRAILLGLGIGIAVMVVVGVPLALLGGGRINIGDIAHSYRQGWIYVALNFAATWLVWSIYVALSPRLVHSALGGTGATFDAMRRKQNLGPVIRGIAMVITLCLFANSLVGLGFVGAPVFLQFGIQIVVFWLSSMMSISLLTEYYAFSLEKTDATDANGEVEAVGGS